MKSICMTLFFVKSPLEWLYPSCRHFVPTSLAVTVLLDDSFGALCRWASATLFTTIPGNSQKNLPHSLPHFLLVYLYLYFDMTMLLWLSPLLLMVSGVISVIRYLCFFFILHSLTISLEPVFLLNKQEKRVKSDVPGVATANHWRSQKRSRIETMVLAIVFPGPPYTRPQLSLSTWTWKVWFCVLLSRQVRHDMTTWNRSDIMLLLLLLTLLTADFCFWLTNWDSFKMQGVSLSLYSFQNRSIPHPNFPSSSSRYIYTQISLGITWLTMRLPVEKWMVGSFCLKWL